MDYNYILRFIITMFILVMIIRIITNIIDKCGINFVEIFRDLWKKIKKYK